VRALGIDNELLGCGLGRRLLELVEARLMLSPTCQAGFTSLS
jgi:hypothetical protein